MKKINEKQLDRIRGALYGVAVGDALGGPLEFMSDRQICSSSLHGPTANQRTSAAPARTALPLQRDWAVFAGRAFRRLRTGWRPRDRPGATAAALWKATAL